MANIRNLSLGGIYHAVLQSSILKGNGELFLGIKLISRKKILFGFIFI